MNKLGALIFIGILFSAQSFAVTFVNEEGFTFETGEATYTFGPEQANIQGIDFNFLDNILTTWGDNDDFTIVHDGFDSRITNFAGDLFIENKANPGDILIKLGGVTGSTNFQVLDSASIVQFSVAGGGDVFVAGHIQFNNLSTGADPILTANAIDQTLTLTGHLDVGNNTVKFFDGSIISSASDIFQLFSEDSFSFRTNATTFFTVQLHSARNTVGTFGHLDFIAKDVSGADTIYTSIDGLIVDPANGLETGAVRVGVTQDNVKDVPIVGFNELDRLETLIYHDLQIKNQGTGGDPIFSSNDNPQPRLELAGDFDVRRDENQVRFALTSNLVTPAPGFISTIVSRASVNVGFQMDITKISSHTLNVAIGTEQGEIRLGTRHYDGTTSAIKDFIRLNKTNDGAVSVETPLNVAGILNVDTITPVTSAGLFSLLGSPGVGTDIGGSISIKAGAAGTSAIGGDVLIESGTSNTNNFPSGDVTIRSANVGGGFNSSGNVAISTGNAVGSNIPGVLSLTGGIGGNTGPGGPINITGGNAGALSNGVGGVIVLTGGVGGTTGPGGVISIVGGSGGATSGNGGNVLINGGPVASTGDGGGITLTAASGGSTSGDGGDVVIAAGLVPVLGRGAGGDVIITASAAAGGAFDAPGGDMFLDAGAGIGGGVGGSARLIAGNGGNAGNGGTLTLAAGNGGIVGAGVGGSVNIDSGDATAANENAGNINLTGGNTAGFGGSGGAINLIAGDATHVTSSNPSNITLQAGTATSSGTIGDVLFQATGGFVGIGASNPVSLLEMLGVSPTLTIKSNGDFQQAGIKLLGSRDAGGVDLGLLRAFNFRSGVETEVARIAFLPAAVGTSSGEIALFTKTETGSLTERMRINDVGNVTFAGKGATKLSSDTTQFFSATDLDEFELTADVYTMPSGHYMFMESFSLPGVFISIDGGDVIFEAISQNIAITMSNTGTLFSSVAGSDFRLIKLLINATGIGAQAFDVDATVFLSNRSQINFLAAGQSVGTITTSSIVQVLNTLWGGFSDGLKLPSSNLISIDTVIMQSTFATANTLITIENLSVRSDLNALVLIAGPSESLFDINPTIDVFIDIDNAQDITTLSTFFKPGVTGDITLFQDVSSSGTITAVLPSGNALFQTAAPHGLNTGHIVTHSGFTTGSYNVTGAVTVISTIEYEIASVAFVIDDTGSFSSDVVRVHSVGHGLLAGQTLKIRDTLNYDKGYSIFFPLSGSFEINAQFFTTETSGRWDTGSLTQIDPNVLITNSGKQPNSAVSAEISMLGNTTLTDIPAVNALVMITSTPDFIGSTEERIFVTTKGEAIYRGINPATLGPSGSITFEPITATKNLEAVFFKQDSIRHPASFNSATNEVIELATPRINGDKITFNATPGILPAEYREDIIYFVINKLGNAFQISYTEGGPAIAITDNGSLINSYALGELHGSTPTLAITAANPGTVALQALAVTDTDDLWYPVISNKDDAVDIIVSKTYYQLRRTL